MSGWIKIHRQLLKWEWFHKSEMVHLFLYLLLSANHEKKQWQGKSIERGQIIIGRKKLSQELHMSEQTLRTCLTRLKSTNEITIESTNQFSLITICKYEYYQAMENIINQPINQEPNQQLTNDQPATNQRLTTTKELRNIRIKEYNTVFCFSEFWEKYDKKIAIRKAEKKYNSLSKKERKKITETLDSYISSTPDKKFRKNPMTYLNGQGWEDELEELPSDNTTTITLTEVR